MDSNKLIDYGADLIPHWFSQYLRLWVAKSRFPHARIRSGWIHPTVEFGFDCTIHRGAQLQEGAKLGDCCTIHQDAVVGPGVTVGNYSYVNECARVESGSIGRYASIGPSVLIGAPEHDVGAFSTSPSLGGNLDKIGPKIGHDVWVGAKAIILRGVRVGTGAVIAAGAVVTRDVPDYSIFGGVPAKKIRDRLDEADRLILLKSEWWELPHERLREEARRINLSASGDASAAEAMRDLRNSY